MTIKKIVCTLLAGVLMGIPALAADTAAVSTGVKRAVVSVQPYTGRALIRWTMPENKSIESYTVTAADARGNVFREWKGVVKESDSVLLKGLMPQFSFTVTVTAHDARGNELYRGALRSSTGPAADNSELVSFDVTYTTPLGSLFGLENEKVIFGGTVSKTPSVIVPDGFEFIGWSVDGDVVVDLDEYSVYGDTEFTAVIAQK